MWVVVVWVGAGWVVWGWAVCLLSGGVGWVGACFSLIGSLVGGGVFLFFCFGCSVRSSFGSAAGAAPSERCALGVQRLGGI